MDLEILERGEDAADFFAPVASDLLDGLIGQYRQARARIAEVAAFVTGDLHASVIHYFIEGNHNDDRGRSTLSNAADQLFAEDGAVAALNSAYWSKALALTDVLDLMPQKRRDEWNTQIREQKAPDFEEATVRATLTELLTMRSQFFAERVDGIFRGLSGEHVTNAPEAFGKRMIIAHAITSYDTVEHSRAGLINDLRCVIARFLGRPEPRYDSSSSLVRHGRDRPGQWVTIDGGALRMRVYKVGTAHLEVHPDMAWRLNCVLAQLYPLAIPAQFRQRPKKRVREFALMQRPLPAPVCALVGSMERARRRTPQAWPERYETVQNAFAPRGAYNFDKAVVDEFDGVMEALGGVKQKEGWYQFDYDAGEVLANVAVSGCLPDDKAHQFYPTPRGLAERLVELAQVGDEHTVLEPSAGRGGLADLLPKDRTVCVEVSGLNAAVLGAKGHAVECADFLQWSEPSAVWGRFDRVVMNPPFSGGRAEAHVQAAGRLVKRGGRLVAILPSGLRGKDLLPGWDLQWSSVLANQFPGVSVDVVLLAAERPA